MVVPAPSARTFGTTAPGEVVTLSSRLRGLLAPNPSPFTGPGTNTYLLGHSRVAVIDPGPEDEAHLAAILAALGPGARISHILVSHAHGDHSALAPRLSRITGAPVLAFGTAEAGRSPAMQALAASGDLGGGEGVDADFRPDVLLADGESVRGPDWQLEALWTPGHMGNHLCFDLGDGDVLTADLVMGWSSSIVSPPDGDVGDFMTSCRRLASRPATRFLPGHGAPVENPPERLDWLMRHRTAREEAVMQALRDGPATPAELTAKVYADTDPALHPAAMRNLLAHLIELCARGLARSEGPAGTQATFHPTSP